MKQSTKRQRYNDFIYNLTVNGKILYRQSEEGSGILNYVGGRG